MDIEKRIYKYPDGQIKFKDLFINGKIHRHHFYALEPKYHLYLSVHYNKSGEITKYIKHKHPSGYYEYLVLHKNGYLKDKMYKHSPYCKYTEKEINNDFYLTVKRYNLISGKFVRRSEEYIKNGKIIREVFYENGKKIFDKTYKNGKPLKLYKNKTDQPKISERP